MNTTKFVNVFQGTGKSSQPKAGSLYSKWNLLKGKAGNVSAAAALPFGNVTCAPYSGGYSSGCGNFAPSGPNIPKEIFEGDKIFGFSHFNHSGCGAFGFYYNYLVTSPYVSEWKTTQELKDFDKEKATVGYYSCRLKEENIKCEVTVGESLALHRYKSLSGENLKISIDISNNGLRQGNKRLYGYAQESAFTIDETGNVSGYVVMQEVKIYFYIICSNTIKQSVWVDGEMLEAKEFNSMQTEQRFGVAFETDSTFAELKVGFSLVSIEKAKAAVTQALSFEKTKKRAEKAWQEKLNAIEIAGANKAEKEKFYSNFYHSLVKPCGWKNESFLWDEPETFYLDFATLWDVYKTQIPLLFALYKDVGKGVQKTVVRFGKEKGQLFNALMLNTDTDVGCGTQACCLGCYLLYDAYTFGLVDETQIDDMFAVAKAEIDVYRADILQGTYEKTTKLLDATLVADAFANLAKKLNRKEDEKYFAEVAERWVDAFGKDGLLKEEYPYYEGNRWNYTFRFARDVKKRIELAGGKDALKSQLDKFFALDESSEKADRFEGFNNEPDMEAPYLYHYVDDYDTLIKILKECRTECFTNGREGLPGNNDSGGLSACYLWNCLGLFPQNGQDEFMLGLPQYKKAVLRLSSGNILTVLLKGKGEKIKKVEFNQKQINGYCIPVNEIMQGGTLVFYKK